MLHGICITLEWLVENALCCESACVEEYGRCSDTCDIQLISKHNMHHTWG